MIKNLKYEINFNLINLRASLPIVKLNLAMGTIGLKIRDCLSKTHDDCLVEKFLETAVKLFFTTLIY